MRKRKHLGQHWLGLIIGVIALGSPPAHAQGIITTVAGNGTRGFSGDGGLAPNSTLNLGEFTGGVAVDAGGNLYVADSNNHRIRKVYPNGTISTMVAALNYPSGLAVDSASNLYIVDNGNQRIRKVSADGMITTVAGNGVAGFSGDGGRATSASLHFNRYTGNCAVDGAGNLYIPDTENHRIRKVGADGIITTVTSVYWPYSVAVDAANAVYIGGEDGIIVKVDAAGIRTVVATGLNVPSGVACDRAGNLYIADSHSHRIRKVEPNGVTSVIAGSSDPLFDPIEGYYFVGGFSGDGGSARSALLNFPWGVASTQWETFTSQTVSTIASGKSRQQAITTRALLPIQSPFFFSVLSKVRRPPLMFQVLLAPSAR
jgi:NHL repeat